MAASRIQCWAIRRSTYQYRAEFFSTGVHRNASGYSKLLMDQDHSVLKHKLFQLKHLESLPLTTKKLRSAT